MAAAEPPVLCLVDDAQWLDPVSARILALVARRVHAESVAVVFAARDPADGTGSPGCPSSASTASADADARKLLARACRAGRHPRRDRIVAETRGNPLALLELPART